MAVPSRYENYIKWTHLYKGVYEERTPKKVNAVGWDLKEITLARQELEAIFNKVTLTCGK